MIDRLLELRLSAFRAYGGAVTVPLDADVVLVHGSNGRGKSSLLAAVELAISGRVADLAHFDDDYPRCLRHLVPAGVEVGPTEVELAYRSGDGRAERRLVRRVQPRGGRKKGDEVVFEGLTPASDDAAPTEAAQRFFLERGYLSQRRLGRLLEIYQAPDPTSKEQPLVRVLRELLGLDPIGHLTLGLHATQNPRWLRSRSSALRRLADEETRLDRDRKGWEARIATTREDLRQRLTELRDISPLFADHVPEDLGGETPESIDLDTPTTVFKGGAPDFDRIYRGLAEAHRRRGVLETWKRILDLADGTA
ncbi:MAG: ATP-binding protein, partial [Acidobacteriota bacterium]